MTFGIGVIVVATMCWALWLGFEAGRRWERTRKNLDVLS